jgi:hypothetical protein
VEAFKVFHTRPDFAVKLLEKPFDDNTLSEIKRVANSLRPTDLELHEARRFGRFIVHDHPFFTELQQRLIGPVSEAAGESVQVGVDLVGGFTALVLAALYAPIAVMMLFSFNESKYSVRWTGFQEFVGPVHFFDLVLGVHRTHPIRVGTWCVAQDRSRANREFADGRGRERNDPAFGVALRK